MNTPSKKAIRASKGIISTKSLTLVKKMRKQARKLKKTSIKNVESMVFPEKLLDLLDKEIARQKKLRDAEKPKKVADKK